MIRVLIADDHTIVRDGLRQILSEEPDIQVAAEAEDGDQALTLVRGQAFDVVVLDLAMPGRSGIELIKAMRADCPDLPVLVLSMHDEDQYAVRTIKAGAMGYLTKASASTQLLAAIRRLAAGRMFISDSVAERLAQTLSATRPTAPHELLSDREYQVFLMLAAGEPVSVIASKLHLSAKTVSTHKTRIMQKMDFANMADLIRYAIERDLLERQVSLA